MYSQPPYPGMPPYYVPYMAHPMHPMHAPLMPGMPPMPPRPPLGPPPHPMPTMSMAPSAAGYPNGSPMGGAGEMPARSLMIGTVTPEMTEAVIRQAFAPFGPIDSVSLLPAKGLAFVNYLTVDAAMRARTSMQGQLLAGTPLSLKYGRPTPVVTPTGTGTPITTLGPTYYMAQPAVPTLPPNDVEMRKLIEKFAAFYVKNGNQFLQVTLEKQGANPKFQFLKGPSNEGFEYFRWKVHCLKRNFTEDQEVSSVRFYRLTQGEALALPAPPPAPASPAAPASPTESAGTASPVPPPPPPMPTDPAAVAQELQALASGEATGLEEAGLSLADRIRALAAQAARAAEEAGKRGRRPEAPTQRTPSPAPASPVGVGPEAAVAEAPTAEDGGETGSGPAVEGPTAPAAEKAEGNGADVVEEGGEPEPEPEDAGYLADCGRGEGYMGREAALEFLGVLDAVAGDKPSMKAARQWMLDHRDVAPHLGELILLKFQQEYQDVKKFHVMCLLSDVLVASQKRTAEEPGASDPLNEALQEVLPAITDLAVKGLTRDLVEKIAKVTQVWLVKKVFPEGYVKHIQNCVQRALEKAQLAAAPAPPPPPAVPAPPPLPTPALADSTPPSAPPPPPASLTSQPAPPPVPSSAAPPVPPLVPPRPALPPLPQPLAFPSPAFAYAMAAKTAEVNQKVDAFLSELSTPAPAAPLHELEELLHAKKKRRK